MLILGGGDGNVKLWSLDMKNVHTLSASDDGILTMIHNESLLYTGSISGIINLWDLDTLQLIRRVKAHQADVLSLAGIGGFAFSGSARGRTPPRRLSVRFERQQWQWKAVRPSSLFPVRRKRLPQNAQAIAWNHTATELEPQTRKV